MTVSRLFKQSFLSTGTFSWTCPAGVKFIFVSGCGGGGGGGGGAATSGTNASSAWFWYYATGGSGGQPAPTFTQVLSVTPGVTYTISIGLGGAGGVPGFVYNGSGSGTRFGGVQPGNSASDGASSIFGTLIFPGGKGGRGGQLFFSDPGAATGSTNTNSQPQVFWEPTSSSAIPSGDSGSTHPTTTAPGADAFVVQGMFNSLTTYPTFSSSAVASGPSPAAPPATGGLSGGGGGIAGGVSNNIYSFAGGGGCGASATGCGPFAGGGGAGGFGGGGGGGGGGEGHIYNNTHDGAFGGAGGNGFIEVAWMA